MAESQLIRIDLGLTRQSTMGQTETAHLELKTGRYYDGGVLSDATLYWVGPRSKEPSSRHRGGGDFSARLLLNRSARATQKTIDTQHAQTFTPETVRHRRRKPPPYYND